MAWRHQCQSRPRLGTMQWQRTFSAFLRRNVFTLRGQKQLMNPWNLQTNLFIITIMSGFRATGWHLTKNDRLLFRGNHLMLKALGAAAPKPLRVYRFCFPKWQKRQKRRLLALSLRQTRRAAQVALLRCPILYDGKSNYIIDIFLLIYTFLRVGVHSVCAVNWEQYLCLPITVITNYVNNKFLNSINVLSLIIPCHKTFTPGFPSCFRPRNPPILLTSKTASWMVN